MSDTRFTGLLFIGDPHIATHAPGFRKDEYDQTILAKLRWCVEYAQHERLAVALLGDLFHHPRDISHRLLVDLITVFRQGIFTVAGNHDVSENSLSDHDALSVLAASECVRLLERDGPAAMLINGITVVLGGTAWGTRLPKSFDPSPFRKDDNPLRVIWIAHHDIRFPGYDEAGRFDCHEIPGIDLLINGHIHRALPDVICGQTKWMNPGNLSRVSRGEAAKSHVPGALRVDVSAAGLCARRIEVPYRPFDEVFYPEMEGDHIPVGESLFIRELAALESFRTASGAGLESFLDANLSQFDPAVASEIRTLAQEVLTHAVE